MTPSTIVHSSPRSIAYLLGSSVRFTLPRSLVPFTIFSVTNTSNIRVSLLGWFIQIMAPVIHISHWATVAVVLSLMAAATPAAADLSRKLSQANGEPAHLPPYSPHMFPQLQRDCLIVPSTQERRFALRQTSREATSYALNIQYSACSSYPASTASDAVEKCAYCCPTAADTAAGIDLGAQTYDERSQHRSFA